MTGRGLAPSVIARMLLELAENAADGCVTLAGRRVQLRKGRVVSVQAAAQDPDLAAFLHDSGRLELQEANAVRRRVQETGLEFEQVLLKDGHITHDALRESRRALMLGRLVRALEEAEKSAPPPFLPAPASASGGGEGHELVPMLLDALTRRASAGEAELVGARTAEVLRWEPSPHQESALKWSRLPGGDEVRTIGQLLGAAPAAAPRLAALTRAGLTRILPERSSSIPPPPDRPPSSIGSVPPEPKRVSSLPPPRRPDLHLSPGQNGAARENRDKVLILPFERFEAPLDDPLDEVERRIANLESRDASGSERAIAWRELARIWQARYRSLEEAARAYREAAAADPSDPVSLEQSAVLCDASGEHELARAYMDALLSWVEEDQRETTWLKLAKISLRARDLEQFVSTLQDAAKELRSAAPNMMLAEWFGLTGNEELALDLGCKAAQGFVESDPDTARALLAAAHGIRPRDALLTSRYAEALAAAGYEEGAVGVLARAAHMQSHPDMRRALRVEAAERAEIASRPDLAASLLLEAFDAEPQIEALYEPLDADLAASALHLQRALVLESIARQCTEEVKASWLTRAAEAHLNLPGGLEQAVELLSRALVSEPGFEPALEQLRRIASDQEDPLVLADALERALIHSPPTGRHAAERLAMLRELAIVAENDLEADRRALWARKNLLAALPGDPEALDHLSRLESKVRSADAARGHADDEHSLASSGERMAAAHRLATLHAEDPGQHSRAIALYWQALSSSEEDESAAASLERLLLMEQDEEGLIALLTERVARAQDRSAKIRLLLRLAAHHALRGGYQGSAEACLAVLEMAPHQQEANARLLFAARTLNDVRLWREAVRHGLEATNSARERAILLTTLSVHLERGGEHADAVQQAELALSLDPQSAEAAILRASRHEMLGPAEALHAISAVRRCVGDSVGLLSQLATAAKRAGMAPEEAEALSGWCALSPLDPRPAERLLELCLEGQDGDRLRGAIDHALHAYGVRTELVGRAIRALATQTTATTATAVALRSVDRLGKHDPGLIDLALELAGASDRPGDDVAARERAIAHSRGDRRLAHLGALAALHAEKHDIAAEARALLRILAVDAGHAGALLRLRSIYARTGETDRLMATLALCLQNAPTPEERQRWLLEMASASFHLKGDRATAADHVQSLVDGNPEDAKVCSIAAHAFAELGDTDRAISILEQAALRATDDDASDLYLDATLLAEREGSDSSAALATAVRGLDKLPRNAALLVEFERLALLESDVELATRTYEQLVDRAMGPHGRKALLYREARWLEGAGRPDKALGSYAAAFEAAPGAGATLTAVERLSESQGRWEALAQAYTTLAEQARHVEPRIELRRKAAALYRERLSEHGKAFDLLCDAWQESGRPDLFDEAQSAARGLATTDTEAGQNAWRRIATTLEQRTEQTLDEPDRVEGYMRLGSILATELGAIHEASKAVENAVDAGTKGGLPQDIMADALCDLAEWMKKAEAPRIETLQRVEAALSRAPNHYRAVRMFEELGETTEAHQRNTLRPDGQPVGSAPFSANRGGLGYRHDAGIDGIVPVSNPPVISHGVRFDTAPIREGSPSRVTKEYVIERATEAELERALSTGDLDAAESLGTRRSEDPERVRQGMDLLLHVMRREPQRVSALRALRTAAAEAGASAIEGVCREILSLFDSKVRWDSPPPEGWADPFDAGLRDPIMKRWGPVLAMLWDSSGSVFVRNISDLQLNGADRLDPSGTRPLCRAFVRAAQTLRPGAQNLFLAPRGREVIVESARPPAIVVGPELEDGGLRLDFAMARAVELATAGNVLLASRNPAQGQIVIDAATAAFGPPAFATTAEPKAVALAARLWGAIPPRIQVELRAAFGEEGLPDYLALRRAAEGDAARAGLYVCRSVRSAALELLGDRTHGSAPPFAGADAYWEACVENVAFNAMLRFAFSDAFLAMRAGD